MEHMMESSLLSSMTWRCWTLCLKRRSVVHDTSFDNMMDFYIIFLIRMAYDSPSQILLELYLGLPVLELDRFHLCRGQFESALNLCGLGDVTRPPPAAAAQ